MTDEPTDPEDFYVTIIAPDPDRRNSITDAIDGEFRFTIQASGDPIAVPEHTIATIMDANVIRSAPESLKDRYETTPLIVFNGSALPDDEQSVMEKRFSSFYVLYGSPVDSLRRVKRILKKHSREVGFLLTRGKIGDRLVRRSLNVELAMGEDRARGDTTGVNFGGLGARLVGQNGFTPSVRDEGQAVRVTFNEPDFPESAATGTVLQVRPSFDSEYDAFVSVTFDDDCPFLNSDEARDRLKRLIRQQDDQSALKSGRSFRDADEED